MKAENVQFTIAQALIKTELKTSQRQNGFPPVSAPRKKWWKAGSLRGG